MPGRKIIGKLQKGELWRGIRKAMDINGSILVTLPKEFIAKYDVQGGDEILVIASKIVKIYPLPTDWNKGKRAKRLEKSMHLQLPTNTENILSEKPSDETESQRGISDGADSN